MPAGAVPAVMVAMEAHRGNANVQAGAAPCLTLGPAGGQETTLVFKSCSRARSSEVP